MREFNVRVGLNNEDKAIKIEPSKMPTDTKIVETENMVVRLYHQGEIDRETAQCMQQDVHTYHREHGRIRQDR